MPQFFLIAKLMQNGIYVLIFTFEQHQIRRQVHFLSTALSDTTLVSYKDESSWIRKKC